MIFQLHKVKKTAMALTVVMVLCFLSCGVFAQEEPKTPEEAIAFCTAVIQKNPQLAKEAYYGRGLAYRDKGNLRQAIADFTKAIEISPDYAEAYHDRGIVYHDMGNLDQAISDYGRVIQLKPDFAYAYSNRGNTYNEKSNPDLAIIDFNKALEINPNLAEAYYGRATSYFYKKEYDKSWSDLHKAESLGLQLPPTLKQALMKATGRQQ